MSNCIKNHQLQVNAAFLGEYVAIFTSDDATMVDECKQSTSTSSTHVKKNCQVNTFYDGLKAWMDLYGPFVCPRSCLKYVFSIYKAKYDNQIRESPRWSWRYLICIITHGLCSYHARSFNDDVIPIGLSYWRREFPNYARLHRGRIHDAFTGNTFPRFVTDIQFTIEVPQVIEKCHQLPLWLDSVFCNALLNFLDAVNVIHPFYFNS